MPEADKGNALNSRMVADQRAPMVFSAVVNYTLDRKGFEGLRDLTDKRIDDEIRFSRKQPLRPLQAALDVRIANSHDVDLRLTIQFNPETGAKTFNVHVAGRGEICRLDVDGAMHRPLGRSHKHSLQTERCPERHLPDGVQARSELSGRPLRELFAHFCEVAKITYAGPTIEWPDGM